MQDCHKPEEREFSVLKSPDGTRSLFFESDRIDECLAFLVENEIRSIYLGEGWGYTRPDLDFLHGHEDLLDEVHIDDTVDQSEINRLHGLRKLRILSARSAIDLSNFPALKSCWIPHSPKIRGLDQCLNLSFLSLDGYKPKTRDLTEFPVLPKLRVLRFVRGRLDSLKGIGSLKLRHLELAYIRNLKSCRDMLEIADTLEELDIDHCPNIADLVQLAGMHKLEVCRISESGSFPSLRFINEMSSLRVFTFWDTNVLDGDLSPLKRLEFAGFDNKRHYSHKSSEFRRNSDE